MSDENVGKPEDERNPEDEAKGSVEDEDGDDDDDLDEEFDEDLVDAARVVGLNPDDFDTERELERETQTRVRALETSPAGAATDTVEEKELNLAALEVALKNKDDLDEGLVAALEKLAADSGANFKKLVERLEARTGDEQALTKRIGELSRQVSRLGAQEVQHRLDDWIADSKSVQAYLGEGKTRNLDPDGKFARRRRALSHRADTIAGRQRGGFTMEQMFKRAFKKMHAVEKDDPKKSKGATRMARASGSKPTDFSGGSDESPEAVKREAVDVVAKFRRNAG